MWKFVILGLFVALSTMLGVSCQTAAPAPNTAANDAQKTPEVKTGGQPVLVELFTSEGCNSCPAADKALALLEKDQPVSGAQIIVLALHVDYFDSQGWKDPFASPQFTKRQGWYTGKFNLESNYTPQMVVDGSSEFVGSDSQKASMVIAQKAREAKTNVTLSQNNGKLKIQVAAMDGIKNSTVFLAIAENNLSNNIKGGENSGMQLSHTAVVRQLGSVGKLDPEHKGFEAEVNLRFQENWKAKDLKAVVFVQENDTGKVRGVGQLNLF